MKAKVARVVLRALLTRFDSSPSRIDQLMGQAVRLQLGLITDDALRQMMADFYRDSEPAALATEVGFDNVRRVLDKPTAYKASITRVSGDPQARGLFARVSPWRRRFGLLRYLHVRLDCLILRRGAQVPPHGHYRVVSGFYLLQGKVACRHYDRVREEGDGIVLVRQALDVVHGPGGYSTNSELHHNIHWLQGIAPESYLFRMTVTETPTTTFGNKATTNERVYIDPTGPADADGLIRSRYVSSTEAKTLQLISSDALAAFDDQD